MGFETRGHTQELYPSPAIMVTRLAFGEGAIGANIDLEDRQLGDQLASFTRPIPQNLSNTADCPDGRRILGLHQGSNEPSELANRVTHQMFGGIGLAATEAAVAADLVIVRDASDFRDAYEKFTDYLSNIGFKDGGHLGCLASATVEERATSVIPLDTAITALGAIRP